MTKTKTYKYGPNTFKAYLKPVGAGWEVGCTYQNRNFFVGNFVHKTEATKYWAMFNKEIVGFCKKFAWTKDMPFAWYCNYMSNSLYTGYYAWLDKVFNKHQITFKKSYAKDFSRYTKMKKAHKTTANTTAYHLKAV
jgi:hypothetical protein